MGHNFFDSENVRIRIRLVVSCQSNNFTCKPNMGTCKIHSNYIKKNGKISINPSQIIQSRHSSPSLTSTVSSPMFPIQRPTLPLSFKSKSPPSDWIHFHSLFLFHTLPYPLSFFRLHSPLLFLLPRSPVSTQ